MNQKLLIKYNILYRMLSSQFKKQMDWETSIVLDVMNILKDGRIYYILTRKMMKTEIFQQ